jgi:ethylbenzene dioxygenase beta subunit
MFRLNEPGLEWQWNELKGKIVPVDVYHEVMMFLYREARLLDEERFDEWLAMLTQDIHYWLPIRENRFRRDKRPAPTPANSASVYNDDYQDLVDRVGRYKTGLAWNEDPPNRVRRLIANVEAEYSDIENELAVHSKFLVYRNRRQAEEVWFAGARRDHLRNVEGEWKLCNRVILLDQHVFLDENVSLFF